MIKILSIFALTQLLLSCGKGDIDHDLISRVNLANKQVHVTKIDFDTGFDLPAYNLSTAKKKRLWATYYNLPIFKNKQRGFALRNMKGKNLGVKLDRQEWCDAAMEGSVKIINDNGDSTTYTYAGVSKAYPVDCSRYYPNKTSRTKFTVSKSPYGDSANGSAMQPYRTIAVDRKYIKLGTVFYIPAARGNEIVLPDGSLTEHDGYFYAADVGGAIKGTHVDIYIGIAKKSPFSWVQSRISKKFSAYVVTDKKIISIIKKMHLPKK